MKDWTLAPSVNINRKKLMHHCAIKEPCNVLPWYWCELHDMGFWFCGRCWARAPEEINFVAALANCVSNYRILS